MVERLKEGEPFRLVTFNDIRVLFRGGRGGAHFLENHAREGGRGGGGREGVNWVLDAGFGLSWCEGGRRRDEGGEGGTPGLSWLSVGGGKG